MNHPTHDHRAYYDALRDEEDAGRITTVEAAAERVGLLEQHLERLGRLRAEHLSGS